MISDVVIIMKQFTLHFTLTPCFSQETSCSGTSLQLLSLSLSYSFPLPLPPVPHACPPGLSVQPELPHRRPSGGSDGSSWALTAVDSGSSLLLLLLLPSACKPRCGDGKEEKKGGRKGGRKRRRREKEAQAGRQAGMRRKKTEEVERKGARKAGTKEDEGKGRGEKVLIWASAGDHTPSLVLSELHLHHGAAVREECCE